MADLLRTFIAVDLESSIQDRALALMNKLGHQGGDVKWVESENLHITLLFLGEVDILTIPKICRIVRDEVEAMSPFELGIEGMGGFPNTRRPKILWVGVSDGRDELKRLHAALEQPLMDLGCYRREDREYTPHLTLGRVKSETDAEAMGTLVQKNSDWQGGRMLVREVLVMSSELLRSGPVYTVLGRAECRGTT